MNYLAHAFLSGHDEKLLVGNFIADHIRGNLVNVYNEGIQRGVVLHRAIDTFTDSHPLFRESKRVFYSDFNRHSGILVDIYFDHLLAKNFDKYSSINLHDFSERTYEVYDRYKSIIPASGVKFLEYIMKNKIYTSYAEIEEIEKVLFHLSRRIRHGVSLENSIGIFKQNEDALNRMFFLFFNDAIRMFLK